MKPKSFIAKTVCCLWSTLILPVQAATLAPESRLSALPVERLSPQLRVQEPDEMVRAPIAIRELAHFLHQIRMLDPQDPGHAGRVKGGRDGRILFGPGDTVLATVPSPAPLLEIWRSDKIIRHPATGRLIPGFATRIAEAELVRDGSPATLRLLKGAQEVRPGDLVLPAASVADPVPPRAPDHAVEARILSIFGGVATAGARSVVMLDQGQAAGLAAGHVLTILKPREAGAREEVGLLYVYRSFERYALALILEARQPVDLFDLAAGP